jgi:hypothetical protein
MTKKRTMKIILICVGLLISLNASAAGKPTFSAIQVCKATAAWMMDKNPRIMRAVTQDGGEGDEVIVSYSEGMKTTKIWCRITGNKVEWMLDGVRWFNSPKDAAISYKIKNGMIFIYQKFPDGSNFDGKYPLSKVK